MNYEIHRITLKCLWIKNKSNRLINTYSLGSINCVVFRSSSTRPQPIMPKILPVMLLSIAKKLSLLCSKLCFQNQDYVLGLTVLLKYISLS